MSSKLPKIVIVDACILFSFFKKDSLRRDLVEKLPNLDRILISPGFVFEELLKDKEKIKEFCGVDEKEFVFLFSLLEKKIETFPKEDYAGFLDKAKEISPHGKETSKDDSYFALALSLNCPIWSDEKAFKKQSKVKVLLTSELKEFLTE